MYPRVRAPIRLARLLRYARTRTSPGPLMLVPTACAAQRTLPIVRHYASPPSGGGGMGGFPSFSLGPQHNKGDALKEYVRTIEPWNLMDYNADAILLCRVLT